jgi:sigma-B regulation protein RsbU (phosphoserine phosphatase)
MHSSPAPSVNFFRNYNRVVGGAFLAIVLLTLSFFLYQINEKRQEELRIIQGHVQRHSQFIEFILRSSLDYLENLRSVARNHYAQTIPQTSFRSSVSQVNNLVPLIRADQTENSFNLDALPDRDLGGNLTGLGILTQRSAAFYQDVEMALGLNQTFLSIAFNLPNAAEASFVSVEKFSTMSPWQASAKRRFTQDVYASPIWKMGVPENNPNREKFWGPVHFGGKEVGLLVPVGAPVYKQDDFRGVVSIETSLDYLNRINADFGYKLGSVMLVDANGDVLAHSSLAQKALELQSTQSMRELLPVDVLTDGFLLQDLLENQPIEKGGYVLIKHSFVSAPWHLVYVVPEQALWFKLVQERGTAMLMMLLGLTILIVVMYVITAREFVVPASKLVQHLATESQFKPSPIPQVPFAWQPWFETISRAFRESLQLVSIRQELDIAANMQQAMLPHHWPKHPDFALWGAMRSAKEVGGDFYDHFPISGGKTGFLVADVSGKGVPAALFGMVSKTLLRDTATQKGIDPGAAMAKVNDVLCQDNDSCMFVTVFYAVLDPAQGRLAYVNAGHPPPLLVHADGSSEFLPLTDGVALGVFDGVAYAQNSIDLLKGDCLVVYTDGVSEAFNLKNEEFTQERLIPLFAQAVASDVHAAVLRVTQAVDAFAGGAAQSDDMTCVAMVYQAVPAEEHQ